MHLILSSFPHTPINRALLPSSDSRKRLAWITFLSFFFLKHNYLVPKPACASSFFFYLFLFVNKPERHLKKTKTLKSLGVRSQHCLRLSASAPWWSELVCGSHMSYRKRILGEPRSNCCHFLAYKQYRTCWHWKNEQTESTSKKGDYLDLWMLLLGMHKQYRWQPLIAKGVFILLLTLV